MKSVQIQSFFWSVFSYIQTQSRSLHSVPIQENTDQKKLRIWILFTQCDVKKESRTFWKLAVPVQFFHWHILSPDCWSWIKSNSHARGVFRTQLMTIFSDSDWQRMTTGGNKWKRVVQQITSGFAGFKLKLLGLLMMVYDRVDNGENFSCENFGLGRPFLHATVT